ncbi:hypothetical protein F444_19629, partial [Phytophthora nicotianae P1976]
RTPRAVGDHDQARLTLVLPDGAKALEEPRVHEEQQTQDELPVQEESRALVVPQEREELWAQRVKIDTRNLKVEPFDGSVLEGNFDSKTRDFVEELSDQIEDAQTLAGQEWSDAAKRAILKMFLTGTALKWYRDWRSVNPAASYADSCDALIHEYRPVLLSTDVTNRIRKEKKR